MSDGTPPWCRWTAANNATVFACARCKAQLQLDLRTSEAASKVVEWWWNWRNAHERCRATPGSLGPLVMRPLFGETTLSLAVKHTGEFARRMALWGVAPSRRVDWREVDPGKVDTLDLRACAPASWALAHALFLARATPRPIGPAVIRVLVEAGTAPGPAALVAGFYADAQAWRLAAALGLRVPAPEATEGGSEVASDLNSPPAHMVGRPFESLACPWDSLLDVASCGALVERITPESTTLLRPPRSTPARSEP